MEIKNFFQKSAWNIFYTTKALSNCQVLEKINERMSRYERDSHTYIHTYIQGPTDRSACGETKNEVNQAFLALSNNYHASMSLKPNQEPEVCLIHY